jgi:hypothetical protein
MLVSGRLKEKNRGIYCMFYESEKMAGSGDGLRKKLERYS